MAPHEKIDEKVAASKSTTPTQASSNGNDNAPPPQYEFQPNDLPDLGARLQDLKLDRVRHNVSLIPISVKLAVLLSLVLINSPIKLLSCARLTDHRDLKISQMKMNL
jgi:hypothetical protein